MFWTSNSHATKNRSQTPLFKGGKLFGYYFAIVGPDMISTLIGQDSDSDSDGLNLTSTICNIKLIEISITNTVVKGF